MSNIPIQALQMVRKTINCDQIDSDFDDVGLVVGFDSITSETVRDLFPGRFQSIPLRSVDFEDFLFGKLTREGSHLLFLSIPREGEKDGEFGADFLIKKAKTALAEGGVLVLHFHAEDAEKLNLAGSFEKFNCLQVPGTDHFLLWGKRNSNVSTEQINKNELFLLDLGEGAAVLPVLDESYSILGSDGSVWQPDPVIKAFHSLAERESAGDQFLTRCACVGKLIEGVVPLLPLKPTHQAMVLFLGGLTSAFKHEGHQFVVHTSILKHKKKEVIREEIGLKEEITTESPYLRVSIAELGTGEVYDLT